MDDVLQPDLQVLLLNRFQNHKPFKSGGEQFQSLKTFLQQDALSFQKECIAQTYVVIDDNTRLDKAYEKGYFPYKILGYVALTCSQINLREYNLGDCIRAERYEYLPAVKIARLAVDAKNRGLGIGSMLFRVALSVSLDEVCPKVGCRFLITDAKREAIDFYHSQGMELLNTEGNHAACYPIMYIDLFPLINH